MASSKEIIVYTIILLLFTQIKYLESKYIEHDSNENMEEPVAKCIVAAVRNDKYINPTLLTIEGEKIIDHTMTQQRISKTFAKEEIPRVIVNDFRDLNEIVERFGQNVFIVYFAEKCNLSPLLDETIMEKIKYLIVVDEVLNDECYKVLALLAGTLQHYDVTFLLKDQRYGNFSLLTTIPEIDEKTCRYDYSVAPSTINICNNGILKKQTVFPWKKPKNLKNCPFNVGMATMYPYSMIENKESLQNLQLINESQIRGSDLEIIKIISKYFNARLNLYYIYREEESPFLHLEYIPFLLNGSFDACAGGLYRIYRDLVYYSGIYTRQAVIWVYVVERESRSLQTVVSKINGLYIFILFYICYSIIWILFCNFDNTAVSIRNTFLYSWGALIGTASLTDARTWKQKILNISYLILCLHLSAYISIQLYSFFTILRPPHLFKTNDDVMESGRTAYLNYDTKFFVEDEKYKAFANTSEDCANFQDCEDKTVAHKGLTVIPEGYFHPYQANTAVNDEARVFRPLENILVIYHEMIVRKQSPYSGDFEIIVQRLFEAGICNRLYSEAIGLLLEAKAKSAYTNIMTNSYSCQSGCPITVSQIAWAIYLWVIGCGISFSVFVIEITLKKGFKVQPALRN